LSSTDRSSIRGAYEAARHAVRRQANGTHAARNPGQQWNTEFDGRGFLVVPDHGQWTWGLELQGPAMDASNHTCATAAGSRISYRRGEAMDEWFVNDRRGLEQGWTLHRAVPAGGVPRLELKVRGGLIPRISKDGHSVTFQTHAGVAALVYGGLKAWDAQGKLVDVGFEPCANPASLTIRIDDGGAVYPITIDPIAQQAYLKASNTEADDRFGSAVAVSGNTVVIGAPGEDSNAAGVNGNQSNNSASGSGAAYVFVGDGSGNWTQQAYLKASNTGAGDSFGFAVAISGDTIVVGAIAEDSNATGVNGDGANNSKSDSGSAYVFVRSGTTWSQQAYLKASITTAGDQFGYSVGVSGDSVVIGSFWESTTQFSSGAAYVFVRSGTTWSQQAFLKASNIGAGDHFGTSVAISDNTLIVGSILEDSNATGINGNQNDETALDSGAAYVFVRSGTVWSQQAYLKASNTGTADYFGSSVAISGDTVVVGAERERSNAVGVNDFANAGNDTQTNAGAAYIYGRSGTTWSQQAFVKALNSGAGQKFGKSVSASGDKVIIGANEEDSGATGINPNPGAAYANNAGAAYVFVNNGSGSWSQLVYLKASNTAANDNFGTAVAIAGDLVIVGADSEDSAATGVNGNQNDESAFLSGAAYLINLNVPAIVDIAVEHPAGINLTSGFSAVNFGQVIQYETPAQRDFLILSEGTIDLPNISAAIIGANIDDFSVTMPPQTLAPGTNATISVYFSPQGGGNRTATLSITSDDPDESPFEITLNGVGITAAWQAYQAATAAAGLSAPNDDPGATPFGDGVENLLKYALSMNLAGPDSHILAAGGDTGLPSGTLIEEAGQKYWRFQFVWNTSLGLIYSPTKSTDLIIFEPMTGDLTTETLAEGWERVTIKEPIDITLTPKLFTRIEVTLP
jgi:hypothetical protein